MRKGMVLFLAFVIVGLGFTVVTAAGPLLGDVELTDAEEAHLIFMRSEEKLARDVYLTFAIMHPQQPIFYTIAESEQKHTDTMRDTLIKFNIDDPEPNANAPDGTPTSIGVFDNPYFKVYFEDKFNNLTGEVNDLSALKVGALIEELDMKDINDCNVEIYDFFAFEEATCGLEYTEVRALERTLGNLLAGSENHLCAFISQIGPIISPDCYNAQVLTQGEVLEIIDEQCPEFSGFVCPPLIFNR